MLTVFFVFEVQTSNQKDVDTREVDSIGDCDYNASTTGKRMETIKVIGVVEMKTKEKRWRRDEDDEDDQDDEGDEDDER
eukprot:m.103806 g.103806  ORF g.103806 m.103806 type:complete len:79 (+) comp15055_c4_seq1:2802-3038(+)